MAFGDEDLMELRTQLIEAGTIGGPGGTLGEPVGASPGRAPPRAATEQERDEFLAILGHELRNPLAPMQQAVELMQAHADGQDPTYLQTARGVLERQVEHMMRLMDVLIGSERDVDAPASSSELTAAVALVRRVVELHGGQLGVSDEAGRGTMLRAWLPAQPPEPVDTPSAFLAPTLRSRRILVVDDNEDAAEMLALVLRKRGHAVMLTFDGEGALALADQHQPEVVLLDIGLPGIDGYEVARRLRARSSSTKPLVVAVTGYGQPADRQRAREAGFDHHLVKPVSMERLLPLVEA